MQPIRPIKLSILILLSFIPLALQAKTTSPDNDPYKPLETLARGLYYLESMYVDPDKVQRSQVVQQALKGVVDQLDPHTMLMPSKVFEQLTMDTKGKFGGVGVIVSSERDKLKVISPIEDTPAHRAGLKPGDEIIAIDGKPIKSFKPGQAADAMRGEPDSTLELSIRRKGEKKILEFELIREVIKIKSVRSKDLGHGVLYTRITSFQDNTTTELKKILTTHGHKIKGFILDLRDNPGGLLDQAVQVSDLFVDSGIIVSTVGRNKSDIEREFAHKRGTYTDFAMIILINEGSASASEIVAGALQDHQRAIVIGKTSFGKGSVQTLVSLPDRSGLKITVARYYTPKDRSIQAKGIQPDIAVERQRPTGQKTLKKEADLKGHIDSQDLSEAAKDGVISQVDHWPLKDQKDNQLVTAYTYLRGWGIFQHRR